MSEAHVNNDPAPAVADDSYVPDLQRRSFTNRLGMDVIVDLGKTLESVENAAC